MLRYGSSTSLSPYSARTVLPFVIGLQDRWCGLRAPETQLLRVPAFLREPIFCCHDTRQLPRPELPRATLQPVQNKRTDRPTKNERIATFANFRRYPSTARAATQSAAICTFSASSDSNFSSPRRYSINATSIV